MTEEYRLKQETGFVVSEPDRDRAGVRWFKGPGVLVKTLAEAKVFRSLGSAIAGGMGRCGFQIHPVLIIPIDLTDEQREQIRKARADYILAGKSEADIEALKAELLK